MSTNCLRSTVGLLILLLLAAPSIARAQCTRDIECKGDRICENGRCVSPKADDMQSTATPPLPPEPPAEPTGPVCESDGDCTGFTVCRDGHCIAPKAPKCALAKARAKTPADTYSLVFSGDVPPNLKPGARPGLATSYLRVVFMDERTDPCSLFGRRTSGREFHAREDVLLFSQVLFSDTLSWYGLKGAGKITTLMLNCSLLKALVTESKEYTGEVALRCEARRSAREPVLWAGELAGHSVQTGRSAESELHLQALTTAFHDAARKLMEEPGFLAAIEKTAPPPEVKPAVEPPAAAPAGPPRKPVAPQSGGSSGVAERRGDSVTVQPKPGSGQVECVRAEEKRYGSTKGMIRDPPICTEAEPAPKQGTAVAPPDPK